MNVPGLQLPWGKIDLNVILENVVTLGNTTRRVGSVRAENHWVSLESETAQVCSWYTCSSLLYVSFPPPKSPLLMHPLPRFYPQSSATISPYPQAYMLCSPYFLTKIPSSLGYMISPSSRGGIENIFGSRNAILTRPTLIHNMSYRVNSPKLLLLS